MDRSKLTILTATYNRAHLLEKLYDSLCSQSNKNMEWLVIDDGSSDHTRSLIEHYISEHKIVINYRYQQNSGKMRAHNLGVDLIKTEYFMCVDSDDYLMPNAVELFFANKKHIEGKKVWGMVGYRGVIGEDGIHLMHDSKFPEERCYSKLTRLSKLGFHSDTALIINTECMRSNPFHLFENEKFIPESIVYDRLDSYQDLYVLPEILIVCNTQSEGYTNNGIANMVDSPCNSSLFYYSKYIAADSLWEKLKSSGNVVCYELFARKKLYSIPFQYWWFALPSGIVVFFIRYLKYIKIL